MEAGREGPVVGGPRGRDCLVGKLQERGGIVEWQSLAMGERIDGEKPRGERSLVWKILLKGKTL